MFFLRPSLSKIKMFILLLLSPAPVHLPSPLESILHCWMLPKGCPQCSPRRTQVHLALPVELPWLLTRILSSLLPLRLLHIWLLSTHSSAQLSFHTSPACGVGRCGVLCQSLPRCPWSRLKPSSLSSPLFEHAVPSPIPIPIFMLYRSHYDRWH